MFEILYSERIDLARFLLLTLSLEQQPATSKKSEGIMFLPIMIRKTPIAMAKKTTMDTISVAKANGRVQAGSA